MLGDRDAAVAVLQTVLSVLSALSQTLWQLDPIWGPLRGYPPFDELTVSPLMSTVDLGATD